MYAKLEDILSSSKREFLLMAISDYKVTEIENVEDIEKKGVLEDEEIKRIINECIEDASSEIDGYLSKKYNKSILIKSKMINKLCKDITMYNILSRSGLDENSRENNYYLKYKQAVKFLESVSTGKIDIGIIVENDNTDTKSKANNIKIKSSKKLFSRKTLGNM